MALVRTRSMRICLALLAAALLTGIALWGARWATATHTGTTVLVGDPSPGDDGAPPYSCGDPTNHCDTIQHGIDHANAGDIIDVAAGTYAEELTIAQDGLTLTGDPSGSCPGAGIAAPVLDNSDAAGDAITISAGVSNLTIEGFVIHNYDGNAIVTSSTTPIDDITVRRNYIHDVTGSGILAGNTGQALHNHWLVDCNRITKAGASGIQLTNTKESTVSQNDVTGGVSSQDGILIQTRVDTGSGLSNTTIAVNDNTVDGPLARAGIELHAFDSTNLIPAVLNAVTINGNTVTDSERGVYVLAEGTNANINNVEISQNTIDHNVDGVQVQNSGGTHGDISIVHNDITNSSGASSGVHISASTAAANIAVHCNNIVQNLLGANNQGTGTLDASDNWWGDDSGPFASTNPDGTGDPVSDDIDFSPFLAAPESSPCAPPTPTATSTATGSPTRTSTATHTPTRTFTPTPTGTLPTSTLTSTPTRTSTSTFTPTGTLPTSTRTPTPTRTSTATATSTQSPTSPPVATSTETDTPTRTATATRTNTPTATMTGTATATATITHTPTITTTPTVTATPTRTHTPPSTPTLPPGKLVGDVNNDRTVNSIDSLLILQYDADLLQTLPNLDSGDVNNSGHVNAVDAALVLQFGAGLINHLPVTLSSAGHDLFAVVRRLVPW